MTVHITDTPAGHDHDQHDHHEHDTENTHAGHAAAAGHGGGHGAHAGHHVELFRRRFWWCLVLTVPIVVTSEMVMDWFGYKLDFAGIEWVGPILGDGAASEASGVHQRDRAAGTRGPHRTMVPPPRHHGWSAA